MYAQQASMSKVRKEYTINGQKGNDLVSKQMVTLQTNIKSENKEYLAFKQSHLITRMFQGRTLERIEH